MRSWHSDDIHIPHLVLRVLPVYSVLQRRRLPSDTTVEASR